MGLTLSDSTSHTHTHTHTIFRGPSLRHTGLLFLLTLDSYRKSTPRHSTAWRLLIFQYPTCSCVATPTRSAGTCNLFLLDFHNSELSPEQLLAHKHPLVSALEG